MVLPTQDQVAASDMRLGYVTKRIALLVSLAFTVRGYDHETETRKPSWDYTNMALWGAYYPTCVNGVNQSPINLPTTTVKAATEAVNLGDNCWSACGRKSGPCSTGFCGATGYCCQYERIESGCDGTLGTAFGSSCRSIVDRTLPP